MSLELLRKALLNFNLHLPEAIEVEDGDCLEIYSTDGVQLIRDFSFYETCGYSLEDIMTMTFEDLYEVDTEQQ